MAPMPDALKTIDRMEVIYDAIERALVYMQTPPFFGKALLFLALRYSRAFCVEFSKLSPNGIHALKILFMQRRSGCYGHLSFI